jgi:hypothetical protein
MGGPGSGRHKLGIGLKANTKGLPKMKIKEVKIGTKYATSGTKEGITKLASKFYGGSNVKLTKRGPSNSYDVSTGRGKLKGVHVTNKKGKFTFGSK